MIDDLWAPLSQKEIKLYAQQQLKELEAYELKQTEASPALYTWLIETEAKESSRTEIEKLEGKMSSLQKTTGSLLFLKALRALKSEEQGEHTLAQSLYQEIFLSPYPSENAFVNFKSISNPKPLISIAKLIASSQICRHSKMSHISCALAPLYQSFYLPEDLQRLQQCAQKQDSDACHPLLIKVLSSLLNNESLFPRAFTVKYCGKNTSETPFSDVLCISNAITQPMSKLTNKLQGLSHYSLPYSSENVHLEIRPFLKRLSMPRFFEREKLKPTERDMEFLYWRHMSLSYHFQYKELRDELLIYCQRTSDENQSMHRHESCNLLARPELWDILKLEQKQRVSTLGCQYGSYYLCLRGFTHPEIRSHLTTRPINDQLKAFSDKHRNYLYNIYRYEKHRFVIDVNKAKISQKTKWGLRWDVSGAPEFRVSIYNSKGDVIYRTRLEIIKKESPQGTMKKKYYLLRASKDIEEALLVSKGDVSNLHLKIEEVDPIRSDLVWETNISLFEGDNQISHDGRLELNVRLAPGGDFYQKALQMIKLTPIEFYYTKDKLKD